MECFWMILNVNHTYRDDHGNKKVNNGYCPTHIHETREAAERELLRLKNRYPNGEFVLLESVGVAEIKMQPTLFVMPIYSIPF